MSKQEFIRNRQIDRARRWRAGFASYAIATAACSSGTGDATQVSLAEEPAPAADGAQQEGALATRESRFVLCTIVTGDEGSTAYVSVLPSLDLGGASVGLERAREFPGQSDLWV